MEEIREITAENVIHSSEQAVFSELEDQGVILHLTDGIYYGLNPVGVSIWKKIQNPTTFSELVESLMDEYEVDRETCEDDARQLLSQMAAKELVIIENKK